MTLLLVETSSGPIVRIMTFPISLRANLAFPKESIASISWTHPEENWNGMTLIAIELGINVFECHISVKKVSWNSK